MDENKGPFSMDSILPRCNSSPMCMESFNNVIVELQDRNLWREFHVIGNEMIITKNGRNLFPVLSFDVKGLEADAQYYVLMEMCLADDYRYKFSGSEWKTTGRAETQLHPSTRTHIHTDSPASGAHWMRETIKMKSVKITNNPLTHTKHLILTSMHKYIPKIHIIKTSDSALLSTSPRATFLFVETEFIAVTAYQNEKITQLKIYNNPFAKGFRESGLSNVKKRKEVKEEVYRKRRCSDGTSVSSTCSSTSLESLHILPQSEDVNNNHGLGQCEAHSQDGHYMLEQRMSSPLLPDSKCCDLPTRVSGMDLTSSSLQTTFFRSWETPCEPRPSTWRFPYLLPPPPPPLFPTYPPFLHYPYNPSLLFPYQAPPSPLMDLSMQPKDYSIHSRTS